MHAHVPAQLRVYAAGRASVSRGSFFLRQVLASAVIGKGGAAAPSAAHDRKRSRRGAGAEPRVGRPAARVSRSLAAP